ncbi:MAG: PD-(D/E)XK nuclease family transposase, partial [Oscillospiraceae bacterium]|nr:PD-(D/E)XK nuclease family transposase [Oscillospiraceae bacterium]
MDDVSDYRGLPEWREDSIDKVGITDDFMLSTVLQQDPTICVDLLQYMLPGVRIHHIQFKTLDNDPLHSPPSVQQSISPTYDKHGVRMDVFYDDGKRSFAVEMQNGNNPNLPRRSRFIRSAIDVNDLSKGMDYIKLKPCYVIFICTFDPFRQGRYLYRFESRCAQDVSL